KLKTPSGSVNLKSVAPYICIGPQTRLIPFKKPKLVNGWNQNQLIGIVKDKTVHYFYFKSIDNLKQWLSKVINKFPSDFKDTYTSSPYFSKNGKEIRVDHNITTIYNSLDNFLGLYGFGWHFWLQSNKSAPVYGNFNNCHESNHSVQHHETHNQHSHNIFDKKNHGDNNDNNNSLFHQDDIKSDYNTECHVKIYANNHRSTHNHGDFGCYNHSPAAIEASLLLVPLVLTLDLAAKIEV
uniref:Uncharacterized protein n=1 Tax=Panagrolaimus sp. PS1159 TaxID=55785 RepID=A0AC35F647_9BILA